MSFFKKKETENVNFLTNQTITSDSAPKIKRKVLIGFGHKTKKEHKHGVCEDTRNAEGTEKITSPLNITPDKDKMIQQHENIDMFLEEIITKDNAIKEGILNTETTIEHEWSAVKRKAFTQNDMKGKQVYLEDTGEKIGTV
ncbi:MAG: hypothetical protein MUO73_09045, partial [Thermoplasmata archaeon]|nr:hypothetical protein [Thermoplasmata archaeon]